MKPPNKRESGGARKDTAAHMNHRAKTKKPDALAELSSWLRSQWLRHYILFSGLANEADRLAMLRLARFIDALRGINARR